MNWILKKISNSKFGNNVNKFIAKKFPTKLEQTNSKYISCHGMPTDKRSLEKNDMVCPQCNFHHYISPTNRYNMWFGKNNWLEIKSAEPSPDPYKWEDTKKYIDRLKSAKKTTGQANAILSCEAKIDNIDVVMSAVDFKFIGGSISMAEGENVLTSVQRAIEKKIPYIFVSASGGMRMMTNILSLMQMTRMTIAINELKAAGLFFGVVITSPTTGGLSASIVSLSDICWAESGATYAFAGKRIVQAQTPGELPENFQTAEWARDKSGQIDLVLDRKDIYPSISKILSILLKKNSAIKTVENETTESNTALTKAS